MGACLHNCSGYYAAELGFLKHESNWFADSNIHNCFQLRAEGGHVVADFEHLPLASESMDCIIAGHVLEFVRSPHQVLREIDRALIPEGQMIALLFNPYSMQGINKWFHHRNNAPWCGRYYSVWRLKDWFSLLGFEVQTVHHLMPPFVTCERLGRISRLFSRYSPWFGSLVIITAKKRVSRLTPLHVHGEIRPFIKSHIVQPTAFGSDLHAAKNIEHIH